MRGDVLKIKPHHTAAARAIFQLVAPALRAAAGRYVIAIGGESGAGKSETAAELARVAGEAGVRAAIIQQDDYFRLPPASNRRRREADLEWVGPGEVRLKLLDENLALARDAGVSALEKPLSLFEEDALVTETLPLAGVRLVIVEGTYTPALANVDYRVFIDRDYRATLAARRERGREAADDFLERVLAREHEIIAALKARADAVVNDDFTVTAVRR